MDWLRSEDLKEEKNVTTPVTTIAGHAPGRHRWLMVLLNLSTQSALFLGVLSG
jgi:hypothetical protein